MPTYLTNGNHDGAVQGFVTATQSADARGHRLLQAVHQLADHRRAGRRRDHVGSGFTVPPTRAGGSWTGPAEGDLRRGDPARRARVRLRGPAQNAASAGSASYYAWTPKKGLRFVSLDTVSEGTGAKGGAEGNLDDPQYQWLRGELRRAKAARQLVVVFGHHPIRRLIAGTPDEAAGPCTGAKGCDSDPRASTPSACARTSSGC